MGNCLKKKNDHMKQKLNLMMSKNVQVHTTNPGKQIIFLDLHNQEYHFSIGTKVRKIITNDPDIIQYLKSHAKDFYIIHKENGWYHIIIRCFNIVNATNQIIWKDDSINSIVKREINIKPIKNFIYFYYA